MLYTPFNFQNYTIMDEYSDSSIKSYTFQGLRTLTSSSQLLTEQLTTWRSIVMLIMKHFRQTRILFQKTYKAFYGRC